MPGAPPQTRLALGVHGGEKQAAEQTEVFEEMDLLTHPLRGVVFFPVRMAGQGRRDHRGSQDGGTGPAPLAGGKGEPTGKMQDPVEAYQGTRVLGDPLRDLVGDHAFHRRDELIGERFGARHQRVRIPDRTEPLHDEGGGEHRSGQHPDERHVLGHTRNPSGLNEPGPMRRDEGDAGPAGPRHKVIQRRQDECPTFSNGVAPPG